MARTVQDLWDEMNEYVESGKTYHFECTHEGEYQPFEGKPLKMGEDAMLVRITKGNDEVNEGSTIWIEMEDFCFMEIIEV